MKSLILLVATYVASSSSAAAPPHPAVLAVRQEENRLPPHLRSPLLYNARLRQILALTGALHHNEMLVYNREADKIPRFQIYKLLTHAGFYPRNPYWHQQNFHQYPRVHPGNFEHLNHGATFEKLHHTGNFEHLNEASIFSNPDFLQQL